VLILFARTDGSTVRTHFRHEGAATLVRKDRPADAAVTFRTPRRLHGTQPPPARWPDSAATAHVRAGKFRAERNWLPWRVGPRPSRAHRPTSLPVGAPAPLNPLSPLHRSPVPTSGIPAQAKSTSRQRPAGIRTRYRRADTSTGADAARPTAQAKELPLCTKGQLWSECQSHVSHNTCGGMPACAPHQLCVTAPREVGAAGIRQERTLARDKRPADAAGPFRTR